MKKMAIFMAVTLLVACLPLVGISLMTNSVSAEMLSEEEMSEIYAGQMIVINDLDKLYKSAAALQSNIGAIVAPGNINVTSLSTNDNMAKVRNKGNSAAALQSNIGAVVSLEGNVNGFAIDNYNKACVENRYVEQKTKTKNTNGKNKGIIAKSLQFKCPQAEAGLVINPVDPVYSAIASQSNIGAAVALDGSIQNGYVHNTNIANVSNGPAKCMRRPPCMPGNFTP